MSIPLDGAMITVLGWALISLVALYALSILAALFKEHSKLGFAGGLLILLLVAVGYWAGA